MQTIIHPYWLDLSVPAKAAEYAAMCEQAKAHGLRKLVMGSLGSDYSSTIANAKAGARTVTLETECLFNDQWNTACGMRVFDWWEEAFIPNKNIKAGHWLEQTAEMRAIRDNTHKCGYCGKQEPAAKGLVFCPHCLDSEYLKESDLLLLRMRPISGERGKFPPLTDAELAHLLPLYRVAQKHGSTERGRARIAKATRDIETDYTNAVRKAAVERDAKRWIVANMPGMLGQYIYYSHSDKHTFGWRDKGLSADQVALVLECISEFPFGYEIVCADGRKLTAEN